MHYSPRKGRMVLLTGLVTTGWAAITACTLDTASVTNPEGVAQTLVRFTGSGDNTQIVFDITSAAVVGVQGRREGFEFDLYVPVGEPFSERGSSGITFSVRLTDFTNTMAATFQVRQGFQRIKIKAADFVATAGSPVFATTNFAVMRFVMAAKASVTHVVQFRNFGIMGQSRPMVCVQFDDIGESVALTAGPILAARGIPGSCAVISDGIGQDAHVGYNRMTVSEMLALKRAGWDFTNHTKTHGAADPFLADETQATCETEIQTCRDAIISNGLGNGISEHLFCAPYGEWETNYWAAAAASGCKLFRGVVGDGGTVPPVSEGDVIYSPMVQVPVFYVVAATTTAAILTWVDSLIGKGGFGILLYHHVVAVSGADIERSTANFTADMDGLLARDSDIDFVNMTELFERTRL